LLIFLTKHDKLFKKEGEVNMYPNQPQQPPQGQWQGYPPQMPPQPPPPHPGKGLATASLVLGIISLAMFCVIYAAIPCAIIAIILGAVAKSKKVPGGAATAGIVMGVIAIGVAIIAIVALASWLNSILPWASWSIELP